VTTRGVRIEQDRRTVIRLIEQRKMPFTVQITAGAPRSLEQNRLQRLWLLEAEEQGDQTAEEYRGYCKLHLAVPILRAENDAFREQYDRIVRPLPYEMKLQIMQVPLDLPVTRLMTTKQKTRFLDAMHQHFTSLGFRLTEPGPGYGEPLE
jgi:hypothetical protein